MSAKFDAAVRKEQFRHHFLMTANMLGEPDAIKATNPFRPTLQELHDHRKAVRRLLKKIDDECNKHIEKREETPDELVDAGAFAGDIISRLTAQIDELTKSRRGEATTAASRALRTAEEFRAHYRTEEPQPWDSEQIGIADFVRAVAGLSGTSEVAKRALSIGTDSAGGYLVPFAVMPRILEALAPVSSLLTAGAGIVPIEFGAKTYTTAAVNAIPTASWRAESGNVATSDPAFRNVVATPHSLAFQFKVSRELLADAENMEGALLAVIAQSFAKELDRAGLRGSGTSPEPRGILNTSGIQAVTNGTNGASLGSYANIFSAMQSILQADGPMPTAAIMSPRSLVKLSGLTDTTNQPIRVPPKLESMRLVATSQIPNNLTVGSSSDCSEIYVGDFSNVQFVMREAMSVQLLRELYASTGEIGFMCHVRADVQVLYPAAMAVVTGVRP